MDWTTFIITLAGSGVVTAVVNGWMNHRTQVQAIKESGLYGKRAQVLDQLMSKMEFLDKTTAELISLFQASPSDQDEEKRRLKMHTAFSEFFDSFKVNRHYLPKQLSDEIEDLCSEYKKLFFEFALEVKRPGEVPKVYKWQELIKKQQTELTVKREKVAEEFRKIIGVK